MTQRLAPLLALLFVTHLASSADTVTPDEALQRLVAGNKRFVAGTATHPNQNALRRTAVAEAQTPFVAILSCADSRVSPELLFDQGLGDLFVCRVAGNVLDRGGLGSLEYAVAHLRTPLIVVLGHEKCGAVKAAVDGGHAEGHVHQVIEKIAPAVAAAREQGGDILNNAIRTNVQKVVQLISAAEPILSEKVKAGSIKVVGARYDLTTGVVEVVP